LILQISNVDVGVDRNNDGIGSEDNRSEVIVPGPQPENKIEIKEEEVAVTEHFPGEPREVELGEFAI
jgi:hypothetical protein